MITLALKFTFLAACAAILWRAEQRTGTLGRGTPLTLRLSYLGLACAALAGLVLMVFRGYQPDWPAVVLSASVAAWLLCERRTGTDRRAHQRPADTRLA